MINPLTTLENTLNHINLAYNYPAYRRQLSRDQERTIEKGLDELEFTGQFNVYGGAFGLAVSYFLWNIPYIGAVCGLACGTASIATSLFGYEIYQSGQNLREFLRERVKHITSYDQMNTSLIEQATKGTLILKRIYPSDCIGQQGVKETWRRGAD